MISIWASVPREPGYRRPLGSGKTTLLVPAGGLDRRRRSVRLLGQDLGALDEDGSCALRAGRVGFVFQSFQLLAGLTALENVMLPAELSGAPTRANAPRDAGTGGAGGAPGPTTHRSSRAARATRGARRAFRRTEILSRRAHRQPRRHHRQPHHRTDVRTQPQPRHYAGAGTHDTQLAQWCGGRDAGAGNCGDCLRPLRPLAAETARGLRCPPCSAIAQRFFDHLIKKHGRPPEIHRGNQQKVRKQPPEAQTAQGNKDFQRDANSGK